jgi:hypothetical protein
LIFSARSTQAGTVACNCRSARDDTAAVVRLAIGLAPLSSRVRQNGTVDEKRKGLQLGRLRIREVFRRSYRRCVCAFSVVGTRPGCVGFVQGEPNRGVPAPALRGMSAVRTRETDWGFS